MNCASMSPYFFQKVLRARVKDVERHKLYVDDDCWIG